MKRLRLAITGLKGAGKTVFLTSLINHLLEGSEETLPVFRDHDVTFSAREVYAGPGKRPFPYELYLDAFRGERPGWPQGTVSLSEYHLHVKVARGAGTRELMLELVDYPGERLLDLPMTRMSYEEWSDDFDRRAQMGSRKELTAGWRRACEAVAGGSEGSAVAAGQALGAYGACICALRAHGLETAQPSALLLRDGDASPPPVRFCPLPERIRSAAPDVAERFRGRYERYVEDHVEPFMREVARCTRQIVLVDVLSVLRGGVHCYNDTRRCLRCILDVFRYRRREPWYRPTAWISRLFNGPAIDRVAFVATKADQATRTNRARLKGLLRELVGPTHRELRTTMRRDRLHFAFCAAHRCTADVEKLVDGRPLSALAGRRSIQPVREGAWFPGEVPGSWPDNQWDAESNAFRFPDFLPAALPMRDGAVIDHVNLDKVFWYMIEDLV